ncbi:hypothetical protein N7534_008074 [Penicillium rubens]|uniref:Uncharacterized protein n=1 Tax=Penicillium chrysogenum TaxID=5076 RepID=A0ABQ8WE76_PENCH|nr:hypothetical protein N7505_007392 [Penicillium chrysogenum]KAJ5849385.1 hypothetical protein N7534_008074 [Penicillium rubens]
MYECKHDKHKAKINIIYPWSRVGLVPAPLQHTIFTPSSLQPSSFVGCRSRARLDQGSTDSDLI